MFRKDIENRVKQVIRHTFGSKSYALIRYDQIENLESSYHFLIHY